MPRMRARRRAASGVGNVRVRAGFCMVSATSSCRPPRSCGVVIEAGVDRELPRGDSLAWILPDEDVAAAPSSSLRRLHHKRGIRELPRDDLSASLSAELEREEVRRRRLMRRRRRLLMGVRAWRERPSDARARSTLRRPPAAFDAFLAGAPVSGKAPRRAGALRPEGARSRAASRRRAPCTAINATAARWPALDVGQVERGEVDVASEGRLDVARQQGLSPPPSRRRRPPHAMPRWS